MPLNISQHFIRFREWTKTNIGKLKILEMVSINEVLV